MKRPETENLRARVVANRVMTPYQIALSQREFARLLDYIEELERQVDGMTLPFNKTIMKKKYYTLHIIAGMHAVFYDEDGKSHKVYEGTLADCNEWINANQ